MNENVGQSRRTGHYEPVTVAEASRKYDAVVVRLFHHSQVRFAPGALEQDQGMTDEWQESSSLREVSQWAKDERVKYEFIEDED